MAYDVEKLLTLSQAELDALFTKSSPGEIPDGEADGTAIVAPGTKFSPTIARFISNFAWQGKVFDAKKGVLKNRILPFGLNAIIQRRGARMLPSRTVSRPSRHLPRRCWWRISSAMPSR